MSTTKDFIVEQLKEEIMGFAPEAKIKHIGRVLKISDGIALVSGLTDVMMSEILKFKTEAGEVIGVALNLEESLVGAIVLGDFTMIKEGAEVSGTGRILEVPVGEAVIGRVLNPLGEPLDGRGKLNTKTFYPIEKVAPGVITRASVKEPLQTGVKAIDAMIPIGRGQRELIIGDRQLGKTALAIDTIINQKGQNVKCVYVAIGQKESKVAGIVAKLTEAGAMDYTTVVLAGASNPASLLYIAPYSGCAMAEYFLDKGEDVLIVYDDLSKHAVSYREISLLLRRPPGREAYPGDVFYLHSRLLERACKLNEDYGGGSITALPIIETQAGDLSAYIPTNVISITDGQIFLEPDLFYQGNRPAINAGLSVSRVGSSAQIKAMKKVAGKLRLEAAQYRELAAFAQFGADLDAETEKKLARGRRLLEVFKQGQYAPVPVADQVLIFYALSKDFLDELAAEQMAQLEKGLVEYAHNHIDETLEQINREGIWDKKTEATLSQTIGDFLEVSGYLKKNND